MDKIVDPVPAEDIQKELTKGRFLRNTNYGNNEVYIFTAEEAPNLMHEVGRLREITFRAAGGGTGHSTDIDKFDLSKEAPHTQLIVWDPDHKEIIGGYRFLINNAAKFKPETRHMASASFFNFSDRFISDYLPYLIELGRSFVQPDYQSKAMGRKSLFALDNLWDGLGAIVIDNKHLKYFFGKVTMYPHFHEKARSMIIYFMKKHFTDPDNLMIPKDDISLKMDFSDLEKLFTGSNYKEDYKILSYEVRNLGENIPPLINAYMNLSPTMRTFGTIHNESFGKVNETGIMITLRDMYVEKINRHLESYRKDYELD